MARRKRLRWSPWQRRRPEPGPRRGSLNSHPPSHPLDSKRPAATVSNSLRTPSSVGQGVDTSRTAQPDKQTDNQAAISSPRSPARVTSTIPFRWISPHYQHLVRVSGGLQYSMASCSGGPALAYPISGGGASCHRPVPAASRFWARRDARSKGGVLSPAGGRTGK